MTIQLKDSIFIAGVHQAAGTSLTLGADVEAELVNRGVAVFTSRTVTPGENLSPAMLSRDANNNIALVGADGSGFLATHVENASAATSPINTGKLAEGFVTLDSSVTFSFPTGTGYMSQKLTVQQDAFGGWVPTFPASVTWASATDPQPPLNASDFAVYEFTSKNGGTSWMGARTTTPAVPLVLDRFNRADNASSLGTAETGESWTAHSGTWGISGNQAYLPTRTGESIATLDSGAADHTISVDVVFSNEYSQPSIVGRFVDANNFWMINPANILAGQQIVIWNKVAGSYNNMGDSGTSIPAGTFVIGQPVRFSLKFSGNTITAYVNGTAYVTLTNQADLNTATKCGLRYNDANEGGVFWNNLAVI